MECKIGSFAFVHARNDKQISTNKTEKFKWLSHINIKIVSQKIKYFKIANCNASVIELIFIPCDEKTTGKHKHITMELKCSSAIVLNQNIIKIAAWTCVYGKSAMRKYTVPVAVNVIVAHFSIRFIEKHVQPQPNGIDNKRIVLHYLYFNLGTIR